ncbi:CLUMA_CG008036, isoform A [Clunio marinus]|uniref:CLUMA_CG008036, isoform A n=1 Tax=Clunio marinus TaxID=568069 RepID=A0A1J1I2M7_9DIPT|nr:CLUMA_CG008036, isoform A [Clunio marinus]
MMIILNSLQLLEFASLYSQGNCVTIIQESLELSTDLQVQEVNPKVVQDLIANQNFPSMLDILRFQ